VRRAFSLAELMIAMIILGLGLLFIAAALPVGLEYTRRNLDDATGVAAGNEAAEILASQIHTSKTLFRLLPGNGPPVQRIRRADGIFRPRSMTGTPPTPTLEPTYEPFIKVRSFVMGNLDVLPGPNGVKRGTRHVDRAERLIDKFMTTQFGPSSPLEADVLPSFGNVEFAFRQTSNDQNPNVFVPGVSRVYPPIDPSRTLHAVDFFSGMRGTLDYPRYASRDLGNNDEGVRLVERQKVLDRRISWCAFYRRVSYNRAEPGIDGLFQAPDPMPPAPPTDDDVLIPGDTNLYEIIIVVTRRPTVRHGYAVQSLVGAGGIQPFETPVALLPNSSGVDPGRDGARVVAPSPWLVVFNSNSGQGDSLPLLRSGTDFDAADPGRRLFPTFSDSGALTFRCTREVGKLLPVGSIFIPAANDDLTYFAATGHPTFQSAIHSTRIAGFVPHAPQSLPIYTVVERPDETTVIVESNGFYPWVASQNPSDTAPWPVWVIPPAFAERDLTGQPVFDGSSPIVSITRRLVRLPEAPQ